MGRPRVKLGLILRFSVERDLTGDKEDTASIENKPCTKDTTSSAINAELVNDKERKSSENVVRRRSIATKSE